MECNCTKLCKNCKKIDITADLLKALSEPNRLRILCLLMEGSCNAGDIAKSLNIPHNLVSFHLKILKDAGYLNMEKEGNKSIYSLEDTQKETVKKFLDLCK